jgi:hypothetical protein
MGVTCSPVRGSCERCGYLGVCAPSFTCSDLSDVDDNVLGPVQSDNCDKLLPPRFSRGAMLSASLVVVVVVAESCDAGGYVGISPEVMARVGIAGGSAQGSAACTCSEGR